MNTRLRVSWQGLIYRNLVETSTTFFPFVLPVARTTSSITALLGTVLRTAFPPL